MKLIFTILTCFYSVALLSNTSVIDISNKEFSGSIVIINNEDCKAFLLEEANKPNPVFILFKKKQRLNKKITAATLAFPFPFGIVGLHRIYLGTKPYVPVAYIGTVGGVFGILPLIDFCKITFDKDLQQYQNNGKVFMWIKE